MKQKVIKAGNSLAVTVPSAFVHAVGVQLGQDVQVMPSVEKGTITLHFSGIKQLSLT